MIAMRLGFKDMALCTHDAPHPDEYTFFQKHSRPLVAVHGMQNVKESEENCRAGLYVHNEEGSCLSSAKHFMAE